MAKENSSSSTAHALVCVREATGLAAAAAPPGEPIAVRWIVERWNAWAAKREGAREENAHQLKGTTTGKIQAAWAVAPYRATWEQSFADLERLPEHARQKLELHTLDKLCSRVRSRPVEDGPLVFLLPDYLSWTGDSTRPRPRSRDQPTVEALPEGHETWAPDDPRWWGDDASAEPDPRSKFVVMTDLSDW